MRVAGKSKVLDAKSIQIQELNVELQRDKQVLSEEQKITKRVVREVSCQWFLYVPQPAVCMGADTRQESGD
jgi:hypothetical protein